MKREDDINDEPTGESPETTVQWIIVGEAERVYSDGIVRKPICRSSVYLVREALQCFPLI